MTWSHLSLRCLLGATSFIKVLSGRVPSPGWTTHLRLWIIEKNNKEDNTIKIKKKLNFDVYHNMVDLENMLSETRQTEQQIPLI